MEIKAQEHEWIHSPVKGEFKSFSQIGIEFYFPFYDYPIVRIILSVHGNNCLSFELNLVKKDLFPTEPDSNKKEITNTFF